MRPLPTLLPLYKPTSTIPPHPTSHITFTLYPISHPTSHPHPISHIPPHTLYSTTPPSRIPPHSHTHSPSSGSCCRLSALCRACCSSRASISLFFCAISSSCCRIFAVVLADFDCATPNHRLAFPEGEKNKGGTRLPPAAAGGAARARSSFQAERLRSAESSKAGRGGERGGQKGQAVPGASRWWWW